MSCSVASGLSTEWSSRRASSSRVIGGLPPERRAGAGDALREVGFERGFGGELGRRVGHAEIEHDELRRRRSRRGRRRRTEAVRCAGTRRNARAARAGRWSRVVGVAGEQRLRLLGERIAAGDRDRGVLRRIGGDADARPSWSRRWRRAARPRRARRRARRTRPPTPCTSRGGSAASAGIAMAAATHATHMRARAAAMRARGSSWRFFRGSTLTASSAMRSATDAPSGHRLARPGVVADDLQRLAGAVAARTRSSRRGTSRDTTVARSGPVRRHRRGRRRSPRGAARAARRRRARACRRAPTRDDRGAERRDRRRRRRRLPATRPATRLTRPTNCATNSDAGRW